MKFIRHYKLTVSVVVLLSIHFLYLAYATWQAQMLHFNDFGFLNYVLDSTAHGLMMRAPFPEDHNHFSVHLHLIYFLVVPFKFLFPSGLTLHLIHSAFIGAGVIPTLGLARTFGIKNDFICAGIALLYFGNKYVLENFMAFHFEGMIIPCLTFALYFAATARWRAAAISIFLAYSVRDSYALLIGASALVMAIFFKPQRKFWLFVGVIGVLWFFVARSLIMPFVHNPKHIHTNQIFESWGSYGHSYPEIMLYFLMHPIWVLKKIFFESDLKIFLDSFFWLPVVSPYFIGLLPPMAYISTYQLTNGHLPYYNSAVLIPYAVAGSLFFCGTFVVSYANRMNILNKDSARRYLPLILIVAVSIWYFQSTRKFSSANGFRVCHFAECLSVMPHTERHEFADHVIEQYLNSNDDSVGIAFSLFPRVKWRRNYVNEPYIAQYRPCWIFLDRIGPSNWDRSSRDKLITDLEHDPQYESVLSKHDFVLFHKRECPQETWQ